MAGGSRASTADARRRPDGPRRRLPSRGDVRPGPVPLELASRTCRRGRRCRPAESIGPMAPPLPLPPTAALPPSRSSRRIRLSPASAERVPVPALLGMASCLVGAVWSGWPSASTPALRASRLGRELRREGGGPTCVSGITPPPPPRAWQPAIRPASTVASTNPRAAALLDGGRVDIVWSSQGAAVLSAARMGFNPLSTLAMRRKPDRAAGRPSGPWRPEPCGLDQWVHNFAQVLRHDR